MEGNLKNFFFIHYALKNSCDLVEEYQIDTRHKNAL